MNVNKKPIITLSILAISAIVALMSGIGSNTYAIKFLFYNDLYSSEIELIPAEIWRLLTPVFIHFGIAHIAFNGAILWSLGNIMEKVHSSMSYIMIILTISIISNMAQFVVSGPAFGGLSGLVYGLFSFVWLQQRINPHYPLAIPNDLAKALIIWFLICLSGVLKLFGIHVANTGHFVGIVSGLLCSLIFAKLAK